VVLSRRLDAASKSLEEGSDYDLYRYYSPLSRSPFYHLYPLASLAAAGTIKRLHRRYHFDAVYVHDIWLALALRRSLTQLPTVFTFHASAAKEVDIDIRYGKFGRLGSLAKSGLALFSFVERQALERASIILTRSEFMTSELHRLYPSIRLEKVKCLPLCVDITRFCPADDRERIRASLDLLAKRAVLFCARRLVGRMGIENLIGAMEIVVGRFTDITLQIAGVGYLATRLNQAVQERKIGQQVKVLGFVPEERLIDYYRAADLFILPTRELEGFGLATIESLACGTPVLATPVGANSEVLQPIGQEFLSDGYDVHSMATGLIRWICGGFDPETRARCRTYCLDHFAQEKVGPLLEQLLGATGGLN